MFLLSFKILFLSFDSAKIEAFLGATITFPSFQFKCLRQPYKNCDRLGEGTPNLSQ